MSMCPFRLLTAGAAEDFFHRLALGRVAADGAGGVRVEIADLLRVNPNPPRRFACTEHGFEPGLAISSAIRSPQTRKSPTMWALLARACCRLSRITMPGLTQTIRRDPIERPWRPIGSYCRHGTTPPAYQHSTVKACSSSPTADHDVLSAQSDTLGRQANGDRPWRRPPTGQHRPESQGLGRFDAQELLMILRNASISPRQSFGP